MKVEQVMVSEVVTVNQVAEDAVMFDNKVYLYHNQGLTRKVFANKEKTKVIKVPVSKRDYEYNKSEAEWWASASEEQRKTMTPCRLLSNGWLEMDFLYTLNDPETQNKFGHIELTMEEIQFATSCRNEVGFDAEGKLRCYDFDEYRKY